jgi:hypothetical protein
VERLELRRPQGWSPSRPQPLAQLDPGLEREADTLSPRLGEGASAALRPAAASSPSGAAFEETAFGFDFSGVRVHADRESAELADALNADAFTVGRDVYLGAGKLQPGSTESDRLLGHELAHVAQQSRLGTALQPKLKITGTKGDVARVMALLDTGLRGFRVSIDASGAVSIVKNFVELDPDPQQKALSDRLGTIINDAAEVVMTVSAGSKTIVGSYATGDIDISDIEQLGVSALIHEIQEQYEKQVKGVAFGSETTGAHAEGIKAESEVIGAKRGAQKVVSSTTNPDGTLDMVVEIPYTFPDGTTKTKVLTLKKNNVVSATWK